MALVLCASLVDPTLAGSIGVPVALAVGVDRAQALGVAGECAQADAANSASAITS